MNKKKIIGLGFILLFIALILDLYAPIKHDFKQFNPVRVGHLDAVMWRSYYERKPVKLFLQLSALMRTQFRAPVVRSFVIAYHAARAAYIFKDGQNRKDYEKALPCLNQYFEKLAYLAKDSFNVNTIARLELEWWIIRREALSYTPEDWKIILGHIGEAMYHVPAFRFGTYADQRVRAMLMRDRKGKYITDQDWADIEKLCIEAWTSFYKELH